MITRLWSIFWKCYHVNRKQRSKRVCGLYCGVTALYAFYGYHAVLLLGLWVIRKPGAVGMKAIRAAICYLGEELPESLGGIHIFLFSLWWKCFLFMPQWDVPRFCKFLFAPTVTPLRSIMQCLCNRTMIHPCTLSHQNLDVCKVSDT